MGYIPVAFVVGGVKGAATSDIAKKANFDSLVFELEAFDSVSGERIVALIDHLDHVEDAEVSSWEEVDEFMAAYGQMYRLPIPERRPRGKRESRLSG